MVTNLKDYPPFGTVLTTLPQQRMAWGNATRGQSIVMVANGAIRALQILNGVMTIVFYIPEKGYWLDHGLPAKIVSDALLTLSTKINRNDPEL